MKNVIKIMLILFLSLQSNGIAYVYLHDDFNDGVIDPAWTIEGTGNYAGSTYEETGGYLTITDIVNIDPSVNIGGYLNFYRDLEYTLSGNFHLDYLFNWNEYNDPDARQMLFLQLHAPDEERVVDVRMTDPWPSIPGRQDAFIGNSAYVYNGPQNLPYAGTADIDVDRIDDQITVKWNGTTILTGTSSKDIVKIRLGAYHSEWSASGETPTFGDFSVDFITLSGTTNPIPEPSSIILLGTCLLSIFRKRLIK